MMLNARLFVDEHGKPDSLQIELFNGCSIALTVSGPWNEPSVGIWHGNWRRDFTRERLDLKSFSEWLAIASGEQNDLPIGDRLRLGIARRNDDNIVAFKPKDSPDGAA